MQPACSSAGPEDESCPSAANGQAQRLPQGPQDLRPYQTVGSTVHRTLPPTQCSTQGLGSTAQTSDTRIPETVPGTPLRGLAAMAKKRSWSAEATRQFEIFQDDYNREAEEVSLRKSPRGDPCKSRDAEHMAAFRLACEATLKMFGPDVTSEWRRHLQQARERAVVLPMASSGDADLQLDPTGRLLQKAKERYNEARNMSESEWVSMVDHRQSLVKFAREYDRLDHSMGGDRTTRSDSASFKALFRVLDPTHRERLNEEFHEADARKAGLHPAYRRLQRDIAKARRWSWVVQELDWGILPLALAASKTTNAVERMNRVACSAWLSMVPRVVPDIRSITARAWSYFRAEDLEARPLLRLERDYAASGTMSPERLWGESSASEDQPKQEDLPPLPTDWYADPRANDEFGDLDFDSFCEGLIDLGASGQGYGLETASREGW